MATNSGVTSGREPGPAGAVKREEEDAAGGGAGTAAAPAEANGGTHAGSPAKQCALCPLGEAAEEALGPLLEFRCTAKQRPQGVAGRVVLVHSLCAQWAPRAHYSEEVREGRAVLAPATGALPPSRDPCPPPPPPRPPRRAGRGTAQPADGAG